MTDMEISRALALAIGWKETLVLGGYMLVYTGNPGDKVYFRKRGNFVHNHRIFDYRDWAVAGPIAERYDCFPARTHIHVHLGEWWARFRGRGFPAYADTPQKAIALAVIQGAKK
jgi:hypothetical protein